MYGSYTMAVCRSSGLRKVPRNWIGGVWQSLTGRCVSSSSKSWCHDGLHAFIAGSFGMEFFSPEPRKILCPFDLITDAAATNRRQDAPSIQRSTNELMPSIPCGKRGRRFGYTRNEQKV